MLTLEPEMEKFFQNGKPGLERFASCVATSTEKRPQLGVAEF
jgi:hypothetical protein